MRTIRNLTASLAAACVLAACTSTGDADTTASTSGGSNSAASSSANVSTAPSSAASGTVSGSAMPSATATGPSEPSAAQQVVFEKAEITIKGKDATLSAVLKNPSKLDVVLRAITCTSAGQTQLASKKEGAKELTPLSTGLAVPAGKSAEIGKTVVVKLTGYTGKKDKGTKVAMGAYFDGGTHVEFTAVVN